MEGGMLGRNWWPALLLGTSPLVIATGDPERLTGGLDPWYLKRKERDMLILVVGQVPFLLLLSACFRNEMGRCLIN
jgi:hypothetical protein